MKNKFMVVILVSLTACGSTGTFTKTGDYAAQPRSENCDFKVFTANPNKPFKEVGTIEFSGSFMGGTADGPGSVGEAKKMAQKDVCHSGGNAILLEANGYGKYKRAAVIVLE